MSEFNNLEWPKNLYLAVLGRVPEIPEDCHASISYLLGGLSPQEALVLTYKYKELETRKEIATRLLITAERVDLYERRAIKKLKHPARIGFLIYGISGVLKIEIAKAEAIKEKSKEIEKMIKENIDKQEESMMGNCQRLPEISSIGIDELGLSARAFHALLRNRIETIGSLVSFCCENDLLRIRNIGVTTRDEIVSKVKDLTGVDLPIVCD